MEAQHRTNVLLVHAHRPVNAVAGAAVALDARGHGHVVIRLRVEETASNDVLPRRCLSQVAVDAGQRLHVLRDHHTALVASLDRARPDVVGTRDVSIAESSRRPPRELGHERPWLGNRNPMADWTPPSARIALVTAAAFTGSSFLIVRWMKNFNCSVFSVLIGTPGFAARAYRSGVESSTANARGR